MARFSKGTTDHDGDGKMGGSKKAAAKPAKAEAVKAEPKIEAAQVEPKTEPKPAKESPEQIAAKVAQADLEESVGRHPGGMEPPLSEDAKKAALEAQFANADAVGDPRRDEQAAILQVRGF
jgi:hypothetical protein